MQSKSALTAVTVFILASSFDISPSLSLQLDTPPALTTRCLQKCAELQISASPSFSSDLASVFLRADFQQSNSLPFSVSCSP